MRARVPVHTKVLRGRVAALDDKLMSDFVRNCQIVFPSVCTASHPHQQWMRVPVAPYSVDTHLSVFFIVAIPADMKRYLILVLICIFLMTSEIEHFCLFLSAICISSLVKCLFRYFAHF